MNKISGVIKDVKLSTLMALIAVEHDGDVFWVAVQETPSGAERFRKGASVSLVFKETEVFLAKGLSGQISVRNRARAVVKSIEVAGVLARIAMDYKGQRIASVITAPGALSLDLNAGDEIEWLVKANEMSIIGA